MLKFLLPGLLTLMGACATPGPVPGSVTDPIEPGATHLAFVYCEGWGCDTKHRLSLGPDEWHSVQALFVPPPTSAQEERGRIVIAIARLETITGRAAGTQNDIGGTLTTFRREGQLDCFSEASNTTTFLHLLNNGGLIVHHEIEKPALRYWLFGHPVFGAHATAVLRERTTGERHAIDSWFFANGDRVVSVPLRRWLMGYRPRGGARL